MTALTAADAAAFAACIAAGGVAVFPADTVYGLACAPDRPAAIARLYALKGRAPTKPAALMYFDRARALEALAARPGLPDAPDDAALGPRTRQALTRLLPGAVTVLLPDGSGLRVPALTDELAALATVPLAVLQSSANLAGGPDARTVEAIPHAIRDHVDLVLDAGPLPGTPSTVVDLRDYERTGTWTVVREGAVSREQLLAALS